jgi:hypothetical protein
MKVSANLWVPAALIPGRYLCNVVRENKLQVFENIVHRISVPERTGSGEHNITRTSRYTSACITKVKEVMLD